MTDLKHESANISHIPLPLHSSSSSPRRTAAQLKVQATELLDAIVVLPRDRTRCFKAITYLISDQGKETEARDTLLRTVWTHQPALKVLVRCLGQLESDKLLVLVSRSGRAP